MALPEAIETTGADFECGVLPEERHQGVGFDGVKRRSWIWTRSVMIVGR